MSWAHVGTVVVAAFLASLVEFVEALTIVLAVGTTRGWRPALIGAGAGVLFLAVLTLALGPALQRIPLGRNSSWKDVANSPRGSTSRSARISTF